MNTFEFLELDFSFNGFAVYYFPYTKKCRYDGENKEPIIRKGVIANTSPFTGICVPNIRPVWSNRR